MARGERTNCGLWRRKELEFALLVQSSADQTVPIQER